jgi:hypothetical protein
MIKIVKFEIKHLELINVQESQKDIKLSEVQISYMRASDFGFTALDDDTVLACAGIIELWPGRGHAWAVLSGNIGNKFIRVHRAVKRSLDLSGYRRIEMDVDSAFSEAVKWAEMLGFYCETPSGMVGYTDDDRLFMKFVRVK